LTLGEAARDRAHCGNARPAKIEFPPREEYGATVAR